MTTATNYEVLSTSEIDNSCTLVIHSANLAHTSLPIFHQSTIKRLAVIEVRQQHGSLTFVECDVREADLLL